VKLDYNKLKNSLWAVKIGKRNIVSKHPSKLLHIFEKNDLYGTYEKNIKSFVILSLSGYKESNRRLLRGY
jgi:hypothetical protein